MQTPEGGLTQNAARMISTHRLSSLVLTESRSSRYADGAFSLERCLKGEERTPASSSSSPAPHSLSFRRYARLSSHLRPPSSAQPPPRPRLHAPLLLPQVGLSPSFSAVGRRDVRRPLAHLGRAHAAPPLGEISARSRQYLGEISAMSRRYPSRCPTARSALRRVSVVLLHGLSTGTRSRRPSLSPPPARPTQQRRSRRSLPFTTREE